uniref:THUMP domain-containing protein n=1 Tax=Strigamia maritima TaxID=126957 RepID=T1IW69_STRMM
MHHLLLTIFAGLACLLVLIKQKILMIYYDLLVRVKMAVECGIEATVTQGLEELAKQECEETLKVVTRSRPGRVTFHIRLDELISVYKLRSIEKFGVIIGTKYIQFTDDQNENLNELKRFIHYLDWENGISVWKHIKTNPTLGNIKFRVSCNRHGAHNFDSVIAASAVGSEVNEKFKWTVDLEDYDLELLLNIHGNDVGFAISLTKSSLYRRNITHFGHTTLKSTIAHSMLRLSAIKDHEIVCDPMCGTGSIPIEGKICWPTAHVLCGDFYAKDVEKTKMNVKALKTSLDIELLQWDATRLPLANEQLNAIITDLPFGKRYTNQQVKGFTTSQFLLVHWIKYC